MSAPLPTSLAAPLLRPPAAHTGLWFDKFCNQWPQETNGTVRWSLKSFAIGQGKDKTEVNPKLDWIQTVTNGKVGDEKLLTEHSTRLTALARISGGTSHFFKTSGRFATGLGREHPIENGFAWHPALGVPYLPGSSVKGLVRAWASAWSGSDQATLPRIFGGEKSEHIGSVLFFDAIPTKPIQLAADVMTPHYGPYYEGKKDDKGKLHPPADWHSPVPIPFLTVADGQSFLFAFAPRTAADQADCQQATDWLKDALLELGAGAKTAVGYGRFVADTEAAAHLKKAEEAAAKAKLEAAEKAAFAASLADLSPLGRELMQAAREQKWETDVGSFKSQGTREEWMTKLEADPQPDALRIFRELVERHDKGLLAHPEPKEGKKGYKAASIAIAKRLNALPKP